jgi:pilus assembly protein Flp/PilA
MTMQTYSKVQTWAAILRDQKGQDLIEYSLVAALIAFAAVAGMSSVATGINGAFSAIGSKLTSALA